MKHPILIVDDDRKIAHMIAVRLKKQGYTPFTVFTGKEAIRWTEENQPALILLDVRLPDVHGMEVLREVLKEKPETPVIMISAHADIQMAVECIKQGAADFLEKPFELPALDVKVKHFFKQISLQEQVAVLKKELGSTPPLKGLVGQSLAMRKVFQAIHLVAGSDATVLIEGESGTGKELVARAIHANSGRKDGPFVAINCGAIPENLMESELFGHEKGAFTGAMALKIGKFEQASGGTLFLDEISELPFALQVKLLRVLQEREIERVGGSGVLPIHVRLIAASNQDLRKKVEEGKFREDLFYRIHVFPLQIAPLRERKEDIPELFSFFLKRHRKEKASFEIDKTVWKRLAAYDWPGNVRELENVVQRLALVMGDQKALTEKDILLVDRMGKNESFRPSPSGNDRKKAMGEAEKEILEKALQETGGNITEASKRVRISRDTFYRKIKKYAISI